MVGSGQSSSGMRRTRTSCSLTNVSALEAEQCFSNPHTKRRSGEALLMLGITDGGRMLLLVYEQKPGSVVRVYSAREMTRDERRTYRRNAR